MEQLQTSFSGLVIFECLFAKLVLKERLWPYFRHLRGGEIHVCHVVVMMLILHLLLGFRELRDVRYYHDDDMVKQLLGPEHPPKVATVSRALSNAGSLIRQTGDQERAVRPQGSAVSGPHQRTNISAVVSRGHEIVSNIVPPAGHQVEPDP